jgi:tRNA A-37 threonylcarbamoyl transferase component Bud32
MPRTATVRLARFRWPGETGPSRRFSWWQSPGVLAALAAAGLLTAAGWSVYRAAEQALRENLGQALQTVVATSAETLGFWINNQLSNAAAWSELPEVDAAARRLAEMAADAQPAAALAAAPEQAALRETLEPLSDAEDYRGFGLVGRDGQVLAASHADLVGRRLSSEGMRILARVLQGHPVMTRPFERGEMLQELATVLNTPQMFAVVPVGAGAGGWMAAFYLVIPPEKDFTRLLEIARLGKTGDTYAFDRDGLMLSDSRHDAQLRSLGLLPDNPEARSILRLRLRDPGGDLTRGYRPNAPPGSLPLTQLVAAAVSGAAPAGVLLEPYRDYRGVPVVGAWAWLPEHGIGIATEVPVQAAFAPTRPLRLMVIALLGLLVLGAVLILASGLAIQLLRRRVEQVRQLGQYTLERKLGAGGMGEVYLARHALLRRPTAVKFIRPEQVSEQSLQRFEREVQLTSELSSPHTIEIYDFGCTEQGVFYYVMEYLPGLDLGDLLALEGSIVPARAAFILQQLCSSLAEAHARGLIHRDIKPPNVILTERGGCFDFVKVLDFGLVKDLRDSQEATGGPVHELAGTPPYIAPERIRDPGCQDARSDLFSVGVIAFNLLSGEQPFEGGTASEIAYRVSSTVAPRVSSRSQQPIPAQLDQLVADCLAADPEQRPASAQVVIERLQGLGLAELWDQQAARNWWAANAKRLGTGGYEVAASAARSPGQSVRVLAASPGR